MPSGSSFNIINISEKEDQATFKPIIKWVWHISTISLIVASCNKLEIKKKKENKR